MRAHLLLLPLLAFASAPALAAGQAGVDWRPFDRGDLAWVQSGSTSGTGAAEGDGFLQPALTAWAGPTAGRSSFLFSLGLAFQRTLSWTGTVDDKEQTLSRRMVGALRPGFDWRYHLRKPEPKRAVPWLGLGTYGVLPFVRYQDASFSEAEQAAWDETALEDRARIAAFGFRAGAGIEVQLDAGLTLGARHHFVLHRAQSVDEDTYTATVSLRGDTALQVGFRF